MGDISLYNADCLDVLPSLEADSIDSLVTDPPAGIAFMGKEWDSFPKGGRGVCRRLCGGKPCEAHGFAKDVHWQHTRKARNQFIAFLSSVMSECLRVLKPGAFGLVWALPRTSHWTATALEDAGFEIRDVIHHLFGQGFPKAKSCLKPAAENWILVRKPGKMQQLQIDDCRINPGDFVSGGGNGKGNYRYGDSGNYTSDRAKVEAHSAGRWPANLILDEEAARLLDEQSGTLHTHSTGRNAPGDYSNGGIFGVKGTAEPYQGNSGGASRFFYCSKASRSDRGEGNTHPTVKSTSLMSWLVKLVTPPGGTVLDCFAGSGSTMIGCLQTGRRGIGIEIDPGYFAIAQKRIAETQADCPLFSPPLRS